MLKKITLLLIFTFFVSFAQEKTFYHYGIYEGLSQESIQTIIKDTTGFIWIGTQEGLNRFDGDSFKVYKSNFESSNSICGNVIEELLEFKNYIFVGSKNNGVCYYDKSLSIFFNTDIINGTCTGLVKYNNTVYASILNDGLYKIKYVNNSFVTCKVTSFSQKNITSLYSNDTSIFIGTNTGVMFYKSIKTNDTFKKINITEKTASINTFFLDEQIIWIGTSVGLYRYNIKFDKINFINLKNDLSISKKIKVNKIVKEKSNYYIATDNGLFFLDNFNSTTNNFDECAIVKGDKNNINSITSNRVYDLIFHNEMLWIGTNKLDVLPIEKPIFKSITIKSKPSINNNHIYATLKTEDYLFIGTRNGLNCIDNKGETTLVTKENTNGRLAYNVIRGITKDHNNNLWLATTKGVSVINLTGFDPKSPKIKSFYHDNKNALSLSNNNTRSVYVDNYNNIWIATFGGGINLFTGDLISNAISFKNFRANQSSNSISSDFTFNIKQTTDNSYWISTENGFNKLVFNDTNFQDYTFTNYKKDLKDKNALKSDGILTSFLDREDENILWIGTESGLHKLDISKNKFTYYGAKNGLTNAVVYAILEDTTSDLWISTNSGLFRFDKKEECFANYTVNDGLKNIEYNLGSELYDNHTLYFGGTNGLDYFSIDDLERLNHIGTLFFTSLYVKEKEINSSDAILPKSIIKAEKIYLKHDDFPAKLTFADLNFDFPVISEFAYKLLPNDKEGNPLKSQKEIQLLNLNSGTYELLIQGKGKKALWNKEPLRLTIIVSPPWYKSNLAYLIYSLLLLFGLYFLYKFLLKRSLERKETIRLKELNNLKTKLYSNITHEFRTPLTVILGMTDSISDDINASPKKIHSYLELIKRNSNNLLQLVNQILDLSKVEKGKVALDLVEDDIVKHIKYLTESFSSYAEEKQISIIFYNEINKLILPFDKDKINKIISNLLSNAIKFSKENDKIVLYLRQEKEDLIIQVKDNGLGISKESLPFIFDRFYQADNAKGTTGTGIGLALTKELVALMNGTIKVKSAENVETVFTIHLPILKSNITEDATSESVNTLKEVILNNDKPIALVVEDNEDVRTYIKLCLEKDYLILEAENGKQGIESALEHTPDIIVSDVMMPLVDGFELCKTLKEDIKTNHIPIILLTAKNSQESKIEGLVQGADAYLTKPFNKEELLIRIQKLIAVRELLQSKYKDLGSINIKEDATDKNDVFLQKVIALIHENLEDSEYHSKNLADNLFLSESQLYRKLKAVTTYSTGIFIRKIKLQKAKSLLETTDKTIAEICYETGFNDPSWFSRTFKQEFGFSPRDIGK